MSKAPAYTALELMACVASRLLPDKRSIFVGTGLPIIAAMLAQRMHAPGLLIVFEAGGIGPRIPVLPISVGDSRTFHQAIGATSMHEVMSLSQAGYLDYGFIGAAQIDRYGNINTTAIGDYQHPTTRLPGSGGANDVASLSHHTIIIMRQDTRKFVEQVDFLTTPGYLSGSGAREAAGLPAGGGPYRVVTQLGLYGFDESSKRMRLRSLNPGVTLEQMQENSGFEILVPEAIDQNPAPSEEERRLLKEIDPERLVLGR
ncbi:MAG: 3-oxoacid CoA-transferase [Chloroflexi bacterium RBG_16_54_18]|nr:MAG: 3-oxoacid CoA-transferase [Chloroflexi bacterium RBG_16_54_18]